MKLLSKDDINISAFGGLVERVYVMDERTFGQHRQETSWQGLGAMRYLAHAHFKPKGQTGLHHHSNVTIITIVTEGEFLHKGSLTSNTSDDGDIIRAGQVLIQGAGKKGFRHNEINPLDTHSRLIQIWLEPEGEIVEEAEHQLINAVNEETLIYQSETTRLEIIKLNPNQNITIKQPFLAYLYEGALTSENNIIPEATLFTSNNAILTAQANNTSLFIAITQ